MRYRYKPVFDGDELIAFAYWTGKRVAHYYIKPFVCLSEIPHAPSRRDEHIKSLDGITLKDYPKEVQAKVKNLHLGEESSTEDLPDLRQITKIEQLRDFANWFRRKANEEYGENLGLATWGSVSK
jgi:hypothetical protein